MLENILIAIIGGVVAITGDIGVRIWLENRQAIKKRRDIYSSYAEPLSIVATALMWRFHEIFVKKRNYFLRKDSPPNSFNGYKQISTLYRLASLLGWMRALRKELSYLNISGGEGSAELESAIGKFESKLADGPHIEIEVLEKFLKLFELSFNAADETKDSLAMELEQIVDRYVHEKKLKGQDKLGELEDEVKVSMLCEICRKICNDLCVAELNEDVIKEKKASAITILSVRTSWVYRDWQYAIGEIMLQKSESPIRQFEVISYRDFELLYSSENSRDAELLRRLYAIIDGVDLSIADSRDVRISQITGIADSVANIVLALKNNKGVKDNISEATISACKKINKLNE